MKKNQKKHKFSFGGMVNGIKRYAGGVKGDLKLMGQVAKQTGKAIIGTDVKDYLKHKTSKKKKGSVAARTAYRNRQAGLSDYMNVAKVDKGGSGKGYYDQIAAKRNTLADNLKYARTLKGQSGDAHALEVFNRTSGDKSGMSPEEKLRAARNMQSGDSGGKGDFPLKKKTAAKKKKSAPGDMYKKYQTKKKKKLYSTSSREALNQRGPQTSYHDRAQRFIKGAKSAGMKVQAEGPEIIAYPKKKTSKKKKLLSMFGGNSKGKLGMPTKALSGTQQFKGRMNDMKSMIDSL